MFRLIYSLSLAVVFFVCLGFSAKAELTGEWRERIVTDRTNPLELRAADMETYIDPNNPIIPVAVLGQNPGGGNNLGFYDVFPYLQTTPPNLPPQNVVDGSFFPVDPGTNNIFGIDGIVGNSAGINMLAACVDDLLQIIKIDGTNLVDVQQVSNDQCNEASITGVPEIPDRFYASSYDASTTTINIFLSQDGGDNWNPFYQITQNFGGLPVGAANGGVRHDIIGFNTANVFDAVIARNGICAAYTEAVNNGPNGLNYGMKCLEVVNDIPNNFFSQVFDTGLFPVDKIAEMRLRRGPRPLVAADYPGFDDNEAPVWRLAEVEGLGSQQPSVGNPIDVAEANDDLAVVSANFLAIARETGDIWYFGEEDNQRVIDPSKEIVRTPNVRNYPCNQSTDDIVTPIGIGYAMPDVGIGTIFIACPGGSLLISELILSDAAVIPTLSEWGLIAMAGLLGIIGLLAIRRRKVRA